MILSGEPNLFPFFNSPGEARQTNFHKNAVSVCPLDDKTYLGNFVLVLTLSLSAQITDCFANV